MGFDLSAFDPTNANSALGSYVKNTIAKLPGGSSIAGGLTAIGKANADAAAVRRQQEASFMSSFGGAGIAGIPMMTLLVLGGALALLVLIFRRR